MDETLAVAADRNSTGDTAALSGLKFSKGHGTGNDFVLLADPNGTLAVTPEQVAALCDRHRGIGGDGLIRAVPSRLLAEGRELLTHNPDAEWFMDYRNGDARRKGQSHRLHAAPRRGGGHRAHCGGHPRHGADAR